MLDKNPLNPAQKEAVITTEGPILVIAGAGAGKTKVITERIKHLIEKGVDPGSIIAVTFTNKAAGEMKERLRLSISDFQVSICNYPFIGTFHSLGLLLIKENLKALGIGKNFSILDEDDSLKLVKDCELELNIDPKQFDPGRIRGQISKLKNKMMGPNEFTADDTGFFGQILGNIWNLYETKKQAQDFLDFDDLLLFPTKLLEKDKKILERYQNRWKYIHIDEYQDTNDVQYALSKLLASFYKNIMVVGDIDQAIYSWRGADFRNILYFKEDYPQAKVVTLEENYRSTNIILEAANSVILKNKERLPKNLWTKKTGSEKIKIVFGEDEKKEAELIASEIKNLIKNGDSYGDIAVLYRTNAQSRAIEEGFLSMGLPHKIIGGTRFYDRKEIKDMLAYLKLIYNPKDIISKKRILNIPPRGIGKTLSLKILGGIELKESEKLKNEEFERVISYLKEEAEKNEISALVKILINKIGYKKFINDGTEKGTERWQNVEELLTVAKSLRTLEEFLEHVSLFSVDDHYNNEGNSKNKRVSLMTMHSAKGLEFEAVFVAGLEEGLFPHTLSLEPGDLEEERRLYYVAITRAKKHLYLTLASRRMIFGERTANIPSRFLQEIPKHLVEFKNYPEEYEENIIVE
ncbi:UvrD-helicase domain-containing protein [Candidatus Giovannonibacteria bacterium]|nr:UvrD-helicase domain-containing protein [Candidatus Giovannonibacteria bacterium]